MKNYYDLDAKGKFIRTCIAVPVFWGILLALWVFLPRYFILGTRFKLELVISTVVVVIVGIWQFVTTYQAYKNDRDGY